MQLILRYILVIKSWDSNSFTNSTHVKANIWHDWICEITLLSKQLLIIVKANASLSSHALMLLAPVANKRGVPTIIYVVVRAVNLPSY